MMMKRFIGPFPASDLAISLSHRVFASTTLQTQPNGKSQIIALKSVKEFNATHSLLASVSFTNQKGLSKQNNN